MVSQQVGVKIRDTGKISDVIQVAGQNGATNISGPNFTIDDPSSLKAQARDKALADALSKAQALAAKLGVTLGGVVGYNESGASSPLPLMAYSKAAGMGGGPSAPIIEAGSTDVSVDVNVSYQILP